MGGRGEGVGVVKVRVLVLLSVMIAVSVVINRVRCRLGLVGLLSRLTGRDGVGAERRAQSWGYTSSLSGIRLWRMRELMLR